LIEYFKCSHLLLERGMQLVLSEDVDDDEGFGEEDGRFNEDD
jgi:hypothetical protein